ncbi:unnamed protein product [Oncorhynchus mykiss]|uniref:Uncharacterized protein n=1 Tax=Oncorhynchus mykiss TaxID=8022 RepID=A0A060ZG26_ONCMY|nr:unnamed protein product [Oncorhynchus mykiss]
MWFGKKNVPLPTGVITTSEGLELEVVTSYKHLGVWLDGTLSFSQHISKLQAKVKFRLGFLNPSFTPAAKLTLIQMTILPMLDSGNVIYRSAGKGALEWLDVLYHSAIRFATNAPYRTHHCTLYSSVNWSSLYTRRKTHWLMLIYKTLLGLTPPEIPTAAIVLHIQQPFCQSHSVKGPQSTHIPGSLLFSVRCS